MSHKPIARNPAGVVTTKPIALRLMQGELRHAERVAKRLRLTRGALARMAYLKGLPLVVEELEAA